MATKKDKKVMIGLLVYESQLKVIDAKAKELGLSRSAYIRFVVLNALGE